MLLLYAPILISIHMNFPAEKRRDVRCTRSFGKRLDKILLFKDLGPRLPFEIGGVWTGDLSLCD